LGGGEGKKGRKGDQSGPMAAAKGTQNHKKKIERGGGDGTVKGKGNKLGKTGTKEKRPKKSFPFD